MAVSNRVSRRQANRWAEQDAPQQTPEAPPAPEQAPPPVAVSSTDDMLSQLKELGELRKSGVLTEAEFEAQEAKILAS